MGKYDKKITETCVRLGEVRFCYEHVFAPRVSDNGGAAKYSVCILIPKSDSRTLELVKEAITAAREKGKATKWGGKIPARLGDPLRDGDEEDKGPEYEGMYFINASSPSKPGVRILEGGKILEALDTEDFYSGCWGAATVNFFPYDHNGNKGVGAALNNVIKTRDDEKLAGGASAEKDFADLADGELD